MPLIIMEPHMWLDFIKASINNIKSAITQISMPPLELLHTMSLPRDSTNPARTEYKMVQLVQLNCSENTIKKQHTPNIKTNENKHTRSDAGNYHNSANRKHIFHQWGWWIQNTTTWITRSCHCWKCSCQSHCIIKWPKLIFDCTGSTYLYRNESVSEPRCSRERQAGAGC